MHVMSITCPHEASTGNGCRDCLTVCLESLMTYSNRVKVDVYIAKLLAQLNLPSLLSVVISFDFLKQRPYTLSQRWQLREPLLQHIPFNFTCQHVVKLHSPELPQSTHCTVRDCPNQTFLLEEEHRGLRALYKSAVGEAYREARIQWRRIEVLDTDFAWELLEPVEASKPIDIDVHESRRTTVQSPGSSNAKIQLTAMSSVYPTSMARPFMLLWSPRFAYLQNLIGMVDGETRPSIKAHATRATIRIEWPGYRPFSTSIATKISVQGGPKIVTKAKLAQTVARAVKRSYEDRPSLYIKSIPPKEYEQWSTSNVKFDQLVLYELRHVSPGSFQPVLLVRL
ncbi:hypothetical protein BC835DRAFT_557411 [Cytidiella melzeri]|nr:hypothetical protein BC835DRAFT_557411 [Cytidiella melzeri]